MAGPPVQEFPQLGKFLGATFGDLGEGRDRVLLLKGPPGFPLRFPIVALSRCAAHSPRPMSWCFLLLVGFLATALHAEEANVPQVTVLAVGKAQARTASPVFEGFFSFL